MKNIIKTLSVVTLALTCLLANTAFAGDTFKLYKCAASDYEPGTKTCKYKKSLGKLQTKEFRGQCVYTGGTAMAKDQKCKKNNSANSCTVTMADSWGDEDSTSYQSCSCTNWDVTSSHNVKVEVDC